MIQSYLNFKGISLKSSYLPLLIEIFTEELPALPFLKELPHMVEKWQKIAQKHRITSTPTLYFTPRRIVLYEQNFATHTQDILIESYGPPLAIAFINGDKTKGLSKAGESFFKKLELPTNTPYEIRIKENKEVLYYAKMQKGVQTKDIVGEILIEWLKALQFGKSMFWGNLNESFIRPVRNIFILLGEQSVSFNAFGLHSIAQTYPHRDISFEPYAITSPSDYFQSLEKSKVILEQNKRRAMILEQIVVIESQENIKVEIDEALLNEIVAITEYPRAAYGIFDKQFLQLPNEVIITSMKENQRYFATYKDGHLHNGFVLVANSTAANLGPIVQGNQKVLKARLSDAVFFYENDLKNGFAPEKLGQILFVDGLGSLLDKTKRESVIALELLKFYTHKIDMKIQESQEILSTAVKYAKADLLTEMVYEFTELQGIIGYYYAQSFGMHPLVAQAIKEQYL